VAASKQSAKPRDSAASVIVPQRPIPTLLSPLLIPPPALLARLTTGVATRCTAGTATFAARWLAAATPLAALPASRLVSRAALPASRLVSRAALPASRLASRAALPASRLVSRAASPVACLTPLAASPAPLDACRPALRAASCQPPPPPPDCVLPARAHSVSYRQQHCQATCMQSAFIWQCTTSAPDRRTMIKHSAATALPCAGTRYSPIPDDCFCAAQSLENSIVLSCLRALQTRCAVLGEHSSTL